MNGITKFIPTFDRILVKKANALAQSKGGIVIPEKSRIKLLEGIVVAVGPGSRNKNGQHVPCNIKEGDKVLLPEYGGINIKLEEKEEFLLFHESQILAKLQ